MKGFWDLLFSIFMGCCIFILIMSLSFILGDAFGHNDCHENGELAQVKVAYVNSKCRVDVNGLWIPFDIWKYNRDHNIKMP